MKSKQSRTLCFWAYTQRIEKTPHGFLGTAVGRGEGGQASRRRTEEKVCPPIVLLPYRTTVL